MYRQKYVQNVAKCGKSMQIWISSRTALPCRIFCRNSWTLDPGMSLVLLPCCQPSNVSTFSCKACEVRTAVPRPFGLVLSLRKWKARNGAKKRTLLGASTYQISLVLHFSHFTLLLAAFAIVFPRQSPLLNLSSVPCRSLIGEAHISAWEMTAEPFEPVPHS
jgi:hypothetical protein